jgi:hypothetical protein
MTSYSFVKEHLLDARHRAARLRLHVASVETDMTVGAPLAPTGRPATPPLSVQLQPTAASPLRFRDKVSNLGLRGQSPPSCQLDHPGSVV